MDTRRLENRIAIITGGARGLGKATAELFTREGATVVLWDMDLETAEQTAAGIRNSGGQAGAARVDVCDLQAVQEAADAVAAAHGRIDILINNAGITRDAQLLKMSAEQWDQVINVNLSGVFNTGKAVAGHMVEAGYGRIINASSIVGLYGNFGQTNYVASKSGVIGITKVWARELGRKGITVNAIAPGFVATAMIDSIPEAVVEKVRAQTPVARLGTPMDIARGYLFLAEEAAGFINGAVLSIDGGLVF